VQAPCPAGTSHLPAPPGRVRVVWHSCHRCGWAPFGERKSWFPIYCLGTYIGNSLRRDCQVVIVLALSLPGN